MTLGPWPESEMGMIWVEGEPFVWDGAHCQNLQELWPASPPLEISNHPHPGVHGLLPRVAMQTQSQVELEYLVSTKQLANGTPTGNPAAGARSNHWQLVTLAGSPKTWDDPKGALVRVEDPLGESWQGLCQLTVSPLGRGRGSAVPVVVSITVPAGALLAAP